MEDAEIRAQFGRDQDQDIRNSFRSSNNTVLGGNAQKEYARSVAGMSKLSRPGADQDAEYANAKEQTDLISQAQLTMKESIDAAVAEGESQGKQILTDSSFGSAEQRIQAYNKSQQKNRERQDFVNSPFGPEQVEALAEQFPDATESQLKKYALNTALQKDLARTADDLGVLDQAWDMAKMFVPGRMDYNLSQLFNDTPVIGAWNAEEKLTGMIQTWKSLPAERQRANWSVLKEEVLDRMGPGEGLNILSKFLDPVSDTGDYSNAWVGLDAVDLGTTAVGTAMGVAKTMSKYNRIRRLGDLGAKETAGKANAETIQTPERGEKNGLDQETAAANADPTDLAVKINGAAYAGAAKETQTRLYQIQSRVDQALADIGNNSPTVTPFSSREIAAAVEKREKDFESMYPKMEVGDVTTEKTGANTYRTTGRFYNVKTGGSLESTRTWNMTLDDNGEYADVDKVNGFTLVNAPKYLVRKSRLGRDDLNRALHGENLTQAALTDLSDTYMRVHKLLKGGPIDKKRKRMEIDNLLIEGDEYADAHGMEVGKEFDYEELKDRFEKDQIEYYYAMRQFARSMSRMHNEIVRNKMIINGVRHITVKGKDGDVPAYGRVYNEAGSAKQSLNLGNDRGGDDSVAEIFDTRTGRVEKIDTLDIDKVYEEGGVIARLEDDSLIGPGGMRYDRAIIDKTAHSELPAQVIRTKAGYLPRSYERGVYANTLVKMGTLNGVPNRIVERRTMRIYDNQYEQQDDIAALLEEAKAEGFEVGRQDSDAEWRLISTDPKEPMRYSEQANASGGRMYNSPRASKPIPFGSAASKAERTSPIQSIQKQLGHIATHYPRHLHRMAVADRIQKYADLRRIDFDMNKPVEGTKDEHRFLEQMRQNYLQWSGMKTQDEALAARFMRSQYETMVGRKGVSRDSYRARAAWSLIHASPIQRIRTANFHLMLGFFNPVQIFIQAQGGVVAASLVPASRLGKVARGMPALATAMNVKDDAIGARNMAKAFGVDEEVAQKMLKQYHNTGFDKSVRSNADVQQVEMGIADPFSIMKRLGQYDTLFYATGERFNRRLSWTVSMERHMEKAEVRTRTKGDYGNLTQDDWDTIRDDANTFMLSMHSANRARWQHGIASVPTQFLQVQFKFMEEMLNFENGLSTTDRARIALTQMILYGGASLPFVGNDVAGFLGKWMGMDEEEARNNSALQGGLMQQMFSWMGVESDISHRTALLYGLEDLWDSVFGDQNTAETLSGPTASTARRAASSVRDTTAEMVGLAGKGNFNPLIYAKSALEGMAHLTSTYSQYEKAMLMWNMDNAIVNKYGQTVDRTNWMTSFAQLVGFTPDSTQKVWDAKQRIQAERSLEQKAVEVVGNDWLNLMSATTEVGKEQARARIWADLNAYLPNPIARERVLSKLQSNMANPTTEKEQVMNRWYELKKKQAIEDFTFEDEE